MAYSDWLSTPLKTYPQLSAKSLLVYEINNSPLYLNDFPILEVLPNFLPLWKSLVDTVNGSIRLAPPATVSQWNTFYNFITANIISFTTTTTVSTYPRSILPYCKLNLYFTHLSSDNLYLLDYFDRIFFPHTTNLWQDFFDGVEYIFDRNIVLPLYEFENIRELEYFKYGDDIEVCNRTVQMLGLNLRTSVLEALTPQKVSALAPMLGTFYELASSDQFTKIIEMILSCRVLLTHLYSRDYINFKNIHNKSIDAFATTHINLSCNYTDLIPFKDALILKGETLPLASIVYEIVVQILPIHLVVKNFGLYQICGSTSGIKYCATVDAKHLYKSLSNDFPDLANIRV